MSAVYFDYSTDRGVVVMDRATFVRHFGDQRPTSLSVYLRPGSDAEAVRARLMAQLAPSASPVHPHQHDAAHRGAAHLRRARSPITYGLEAIAIVVAVLGVTGTLVTLILERRRELATLRLVGADLGQIRRMIVIEAGMLGAVSQVLGLVAGLALSVVLIYVINVQSFGWTIQFHLPAAFLLQAMAVVLAATTLAGVYPARLAAGFRPADEIQHRMTVRRALVCRAAACGSRRCWPRLAADPWKQASPRLRRPAARRPCEPPGVSHRMVVLHGEPRVRPRTAVRVSDHVLPDWHRHVARQPSKWSVRDLLMAHIAVTDAAGGRHLFAERVSRAGVGWAGASQRDLRVWNEDWEVRLEYGRHRLQARDPRFAIDLLASEDRPPVLHGERGFSQKGSSAGNATHYYSLTRMPTEGFITLDGERFAVKGDSWMDHEFGTSFLEKHQQGWDWFSIQLADGTDLMMFQMRAGRRQPRSAEQRHAGAAGTAQSPAGSPATSR